MPYHTFAGVFDDNSFCKQFITDGICFCKIFCFLCFFSLLDFGKDKALKFSVNAFRCLCALCISRFRERTLSKSLISSYFVISFVSAFNRSYKTVIAMEVFRSFEIASTNFALYSANTFWSVSPSFSVRQHVLPVCCKRLWCYP